MNEGALAFDAAPLRRGGCGREMEMPSRRCTGSKASVQGRTQSWTHALQEISVLGSICANQVGGPTSNIPTSLPAPSHYGEVTAVTQDPGSVGLARVQRLRGP